MAHCIVAQSCRTTEATAEAAGDSNCLSFAKATLEALNEEEASAFQSRCALLPCWCHSCTSASHFAPVYKWARVCVWRAGEIKQASELITHISLLLPSYSYPYSYLSPSQASQCSPANLVAPINQTELKPSAAPPELSCLIGQFLASQTPDETRSSSSRCSSQSRPLATAATSITKQLALSRLRWRAHLLSLLWPRSS